MPVADHMPLLGDFIGGGLIDLLDGERFIYKAVQLVHSVALSLAYLESRGSPQPLNKMAHQPEGHVERREPSANSKQRFLRRVHFDTNKLKYRTKEDCIDFGANTSTTRIEYPPK